MVFLNHDQGLDDIYSNRLLEPDFYLSCNIWLFSIKKESVLKKRFNYEFYWCRNRWRNATFFRKWKRMTRNLLILPRLLILNESLAPRFELVILKVSMHKIWVFPLSWSHWESWLVLTTDTHHGRWDLLSCLWRLEKGKLFENDSLQVTKCLAMYVAGINHRSWMELTIQAY